MKPSVGGGGLRRLRDRSRPGETGDLHVRLVVGDWVWSMGLSGREDALSCETSGRVRLGLPVKQKSRINSSLQFFKKADKTDGQNYQKPKEQTRAILKELNIHANIDTLDVNTLIM